MSFFLRHLAIKQRIECVEYFILMWALEKMSVVLYICTRLHVSHSIKAFKGRPLGTMNVREHYNPSDSGWNNLFLTESRGSTH